MRIKLVISTAFCFLPLAVAPPASAQQLGHITFPVSATPAAQTEFVQGVLYLHSFEYKLAADAFKRAQILEPNFGMAYWGEALTYTHQVWNQQDVSSARSALNRFASTPALRLDKVPTARERAYLTSVETLYGNGSKEQRDTAYASAMQKLAHDFPDDDEAQVLYATALFGLSQGVRDVPLYMRAAAIAGEVFRRNPQHPGAAHMIIHAFDDPVHAPLGLHAAESYGSIAPLAPHAQHMTTHIFLALGLWEKVASQNIIASGSDTARWLPGHYTSWLLYAYLQMGQYDKSRKLIASLAQHPSMRPNARGMMANDRSRYVMETGDWNGPEARALDADLGLSGEDDYEYATFVSGYAAAKRNDLAQANARLQLLASRVRAAKHSVKAGAPGVEVVPVILELSLRAELARLSGKRESALTLLRHAAELEDAMPAEFGPPVVMQPVHEALGNLLTELHRHDEAAIEFAHALELGPGRSAALLGLARAQAARGGVVESDRAYRTLAENWKAADASIVLLSDVRAHAEPRSRN